MMAGSSPQMPQELMSDANQSIIRGPKPLQQHASHKAGVNGTSNLQQQALAGLPNSPTKSPSKARYQPLVVSVETARQLDDADDAPDSTRANDQREHRQVLSPHAQSPAAPGVPPPAATTALAAAGDEGKPNKYIQLLDRASANGHLQGKSRLPSSSGTSSALSSTSSVASGPAAAQPNAAAATALKPAAAPAAVRSAPGVHSSNNAAAEAAGAAGSSSSSVPQLLRSSHPGGLAAKTTPNGRVSRSRTSILDSSQDGSLIPATPAAPTTAAPPSPPAGSRVPGTASSSGGSPGIAAYPSKRPDWRMLAGQSAAASAASSAAATGSPARRLPAATSGTAAARSQYAFGSRIELNPAASTRKPSPMRQSAPGAARQTSNGSPSGPSAGLAAARAYASPQRVPAAAAGRAGASPQRVPAAARSSGTASGTAVMRAGASPQRVPAAARSAAAASAALRSTSAPRMSADKLQSRFAQHQASAAAAQRSKTPNPAARSAAAAGAARSGATPGSRVRSSTSSVLAGSGSAQSRYNARLHGSDAGASGSSSAAAARSSSPAGRLAGTRSPASSPGPAAMRIATRSLPSAASAFGSSTRAPGAGGGGAGSPTTLKPVAPVGQRAGGPRADRMSAITAGAAPAGSSSSARFNASSSGMCIPTMQDRYKTGFKHTPAAAAVAEARAAATAGPAASGSSSPAAGATAARSVPTLSLGSLLGSSPAVPGPRRTREQENSSSTPLVALPLPPGKPVSGLADKESSGGGGAPSPFLGRISGKAAGASPPGPLTLAAHKQHQAAAAAAQRTPQQQQQQQQQRRALAPLHPARGTSIPPSPAVTPAGTPAGNAGCVRLQEADFSSTPLVAGGRLRGSMAFAAADEGEGTAPPLLPRELSKASSALCDEPLSPEASRGMSCEPSLHGAAGLSKEGSAASIDSAAVAVAAKGLMPPLHRLEEEGSPALFASPPRHRRGEHSSPVGAAALCSQLLKSKASSVCGGSGSKAPQAEADVAATPAAAQQRTDTGGMMTPLMATPSTSSPSKALRFTPGSDFKLSLNLAKVPRLDLTPVLAQAEEDQQFEAEQQQLDLEQESQLLAEEQQQQQQLLLEFSDHQEEQLHHGRTRPDMHDGKPQSAGSGAGKRGSSAGRRAGGSGSSKRSAAAEPPPQPESFYEYQSVMPAEETKTYDELRRALLRCHGGHKLAANLQGIWGCYQDARRNTEAMAFRGHRMLAELSAQYKEYRVEVKQHLEELQQERDACKEELQLALATGQASGANPKAAKDKQVEELHHENEQLRLQMAEMEKALHKAAEYHQAQQAEQVPSMARTIAKSATASILIQQTVRQQEELLAKDKTIQELQAGLMIACSALKQTNYMEPEGYVRAGMAPDTLQVIDMMISGAAAEADVLGQAHGAAAAAGAAQPHTQIEELH